MTTQIKLTDTQRLVLEHAADHTDGCLIWFPDAVRGGARQKVINGLFNRSLITNTGKEWVVATEGYDALGRPRPTVATTHATQPAKSAVEPTKASVGQTHTEMNTPVPRRRENSKQAAVIQMLQRSEGATINQICEVTGWQAHTVRGTFAGAFKKKLGLNLVSDKQSDGDRIYRVV